MCDACGVESRTITRRGLVRRAGLTAGGAALSAAALRFGGGRSILAEEATHWTYEGEEGPEFWGELDPAFATCSGGTEQSPIDVVDFEGTDLTDLEFAY